MFFPLDLKVISSPMYMWPMVSVQPRMALIQPNKIFKCFAVFKKYVLFKNCLASFSMYMGVLLACMSVYHMHRSQKRLSNSQELELTDAC